MRTSLFCFLLCLCGPILHGGEAPQKNDTPKAPAAKADPAAPKDEYVKLLTAIGMDRREEKEVFVYHCRHVRGLTLKRILDNFITSRGSVSESEEADLVVINDVKSNLDNLKKIAAQVDQPVPQILVEARIVELNLDSDFEKEVNVAYSRLKATDRAFIQNLTSAISTPAPTPREGQGFSANVLAYSNHNAALEIFVRYLESRGKAKILSSPNLVLRRGSDGNIITGEEIPIQTQTVVSGSISTSTVFKSVGVKLNVSPIMISGDTVRLQVSPEVSTVTGFTTATEGGISNPIIAVRNASTELEVKNGELISIGGLYLNEERDERRKVPVLGSLPVLGHFFRASFTETRRSQLLILLSIHILEKGQKQGERIFRPDNTPARIENELKDMEEKMHIPYADMHHDLERWRHDGRVWQGDKAQRPTPSSKAATH